MLDHKFIIALFGTNRWAICLKSNEGDVRDYKYLNTHSKDIAEYVLMDLFDYYDYVLENYNCSLNKDVIIFHDEEEANRCLNEFLLPRYIGRALRNVG